MIAREEIRQADQVEEAIGKSGKAGQEERLEVSCHGDLGIESRLGYV